MGGIHSSDTVYLEQCRHILKFSSKDGSEDNNTIDSSEKMDIVYSGGGWPLYIHKSEWVKILN